MERNTLEKFFTGKHFVIPSYQRDYAWTQQNIDDLLNDIPEEDAEIPPGRQSGPQAVRRRLCG